MTNQRKMNASAFPQSGSKPGVAAVKRAVFLLKPTASPLPPRSQPRGKAPHTSWSVNLPFSSKRERDKQVGVEKWWTWPHFKNC